MAQPVKLNQAQKRALDLDHNVAVRAVAGSGKTTVLVSRYLAILDANPDLTPAHILAITFNDAAASHLRSKIREKLSSRTGSTRWRDLCRDLTDAPISTIHGFCARVLRDYPVEANVDPDFVVLDPIDAAIMLRDAVNDTFRRTQQGTPVHDAIITLTSNLNRRPDRAIIRLIKRREVLAPLIDKYSAMSDEQMLKESIIMCSADIASFWDNAAQTKLFELMAKLASLALFATGKTGLVLERIREVVETRERDRTDLAYGYTLIQSLDEVFLTKQHVARKKIPGKKGDWTDTSYYQQYQDLFPSVAQIVETLEPSKILPYIPAAEQLAVGTTRALLNVYSACMERYTSMKRAQRALDFCDLQQCCADLIETYDHVRRILSSRYPHILVDEFQDTNSLQWRIISRLAQDETTGALRPRGLFVVGDEAQSIYGFRNAEVEVFQSVRKNIRDTNGINAESCQNFRSAPRVIEAINTLFRDNEDCIPIKTYRNKTEGAVEVIVADSDGENLKSYEQCAVEARLVASRIIAATRPGLMEIRIESKRNEIKRAEFGDIAVLLRSRTHMSAVLDAFKNASIPYYTPGGTGFFAQQEIWDILTAIRCVAIPDDEMALAGYLRSPMAGVSDETLFAISLETGHSFSEKLRKFAGKTSNRPDSTIIAETLDRLDRWRRYAGRVTIDSLIRRICDETGVWASLESGAGAPQPAENVERLIYIARTFLSGNSRDIRAFLDRIDFLVDSDWQQSEAAIADEAARSVSVMTVHAAKGLEFPVVIVMQCHHTYNFGLRDTIQIHKNKGIAFKAPDPDNRFAKVETHAYRAVRKAVKDATVREEMRLLHVACTRARDALILTGFGTEPKGGSSWWSHILRNL
ncbi:MAG: UvrD-helicase domain-containing protein, partial [Candidatus Hydrogenedentes bacterium]|nr:UvrD-helicase domain-containing protein [Candidatus Hydrogenedentota bacterium]